MPESVEKLAERLDAARGNVADLESEAADLESEVEAAVTAGDLDRADSIRDHRDGVLTRLDRRRSDVASLEAAVADARTHAQHAAAARHQQDKADELHGIRSEFQSEASELIEAADAFLDRIQPALDLRDEHRAVTAEIDVVDRLFPDVDRPEVAPFPEEEFEHLRDRVRELYARCETLARNYPRDARSGARGIMLERRRGDLFGDEPGIGRVYSRARGLRGLLSEETREIAEPKIRERLAELYDQVRPERRSKYREPGE